MKESSKDRIEKLRTERRKLRKLLIEVNQLHRAICTFVVGINKVELKYWRVKNRLEDRICGLMSRESDINTLKRIERAKRTED